MKREIKVGIFAVAVLLVGWGVVRYLKGSDIFGNSNVYYAYYQQVGGLQTASHVLINGVKVGSVTAVTLNEDPAKGVELEISVDKQFRIPVNSVAKIFNDGIMGGKAVEIVYGNAAEYLPNKGTINSAMGVDLFSMAGDELGGMMEKVGLVIDNLTQTLNGINSLMAENTAHISGIVSNVDGITCNVNNMLIKERAHLEQALASLTDFSKSLGDNADQVGQIIGNMNDFSSELAEANIVNTIEQTVGELNKMLLAVNDHTGSVGKLLDDPQLYDNLAAASDNLSSLLADLKENPHRYINISVFGSNPTKKAEKAKAKAEKKAIKRADEAAERQAELEAAEAKSKLRAIESNNQ